MSLDIAHANVNRNITLAGTSIAIFTFLLFFLYPRYSEGTIDPFLFQFTIAVIVSVIFSLVTSGLYYYSNTLTMSAPPDRPGQLFGKAEGYWLIGYSLMLLEPSLILFTVNLIAIGVYSLILWLAYLYLTGLHYRKHSKTK